MVKPLFLRGDGTWASPQESLLKSDDDLWEEVYAKYGFKCTCSHPPHRPPCSWCEGGWRDDIDSISAKNDNDQDDLALRTYEDWGSF